MNSVKTIDTLNQRNIFLCDYGPPILIFEMYSTRTCVLVGGALLVLEKMLNESKDGPVQTLIFDIGMLIGAEGRERTSTEYIDLLEGHGFQDCHVKLISTAQWRDAVLARKH